MMLKSPREVLAILSFSQTGSSVRPMEVRDLAQIRRPV